MVNTRQPRRTLLFASATHVWSDLFFTLLIPLLVLIKVDFTLTFTEVGLLKSGNMLASALLQVPSGFLAEKIGEYWLLIGGNIWVAAGLVAMSLANSYIFLLLTALLGGLGGGTQHPLGSSLVSRAYEKKGRSTAVGTVNFAGDLGKLAAPGLSLLIATRYGWRMTMRLTGLTGIIFMIFTLIAKKNMESSKSNGVKDQHVKRNLDPKIPGFINLSIVGFLDSATRGATLTFLPFVFGEKGMSTNQIFALLILLLAGGASGKFLCGWLSERLNAIKLIWITKLLTASLLVLVPVTPNLLLVPMMVLLGIGLNGTSSVLYASLANLVPPTRRSRLYGFFYTTNEIGSTLAPIIYGVLSDLLNLRTTIFIMAVVAAAIMPASMPLRHHLALTKASDQKSLM